MVLKYFFGVSCLFESVQILVSEIVEDNILVSEVVVDANNVDALLVQTSALFPACARIRCRRSQYQSLFYEAAMDEQNEDESRV